MKKILALFIYSIICFSGFAEWIEIPENSRKPLFDHIENNSESIRLEFSLNGYEQENITERGVVYQKISYRNEGEFLEIGKPDLPEFSRLVVIPDEGELSFEIISIEYEIITDIIVYPQQRLQVESQPIDQEFIIAEDFYGNDSIFPDKIISLGNPAIMRDYRVINVTVNPFQFDPKTRELKIIKNVDFTLNCTTKNGINTKQGNQKKSRSFDSVYSSAIINYETIRSRDDEFQQPCYLFIYPNSTSVEQNLQYLIDWKHQKGFDVVAVTTSETGSSLNSIKNYIQNAYDNWENPPEFICLVGDAGGNFSIPTAHLDGGEGDHFYTLLDGEDILSDAFIGRLSFNDIFEFQTIISKILHYEKEPYLEETNWYNKVLLVGDPTYSGQSCVDTKVFIKEMIDEHCSNMICEEVYSEPWLLQMFNGLNNGAGYFNYRGYLGMSGFYNGHIDGLTNNFQLPIAVFLTCSVGDFEGTDDCRSERFLKAGTPTLPTGAIAAIGTATSDTNTCFNNCMDAGIYFGIFVDKISHIGGAFNRGKLNLYNSYPNNPFNAVYKFSYWNNLMGDPGLEMWTDIPEELNVIYSSQVPVGSNYLEVTVQDNNGFPIENAWVTAADDDEIFTTAFTNSDGLVILSLNADIESEVNLTITKQNYIPHLGSFEIIQSNIFLSVSEIVIDDDNSGESSGNENGIINPGENIELNVGLLNSGLIETNSVTATITSVSDFITISDNTEYYGTIAPGNEVFSTDDFDFFVYENVIGGDEILLNILIEDGNNNYCEDLIYLEVVGANLIFHDYSVIDDENGVLDPGETSPIFITIENTGDLNINEVYSFLSSDDENIIINDPVGHFGTINAGETASNIENTFEISASENILPEQEFSLDLQLYNDQGYNNTITFILTVGEAIITDPLGPDEFNYYCYDSGDLGYGSTPIYNWIEIDPVLGGSGSVLSLYDTGDMGDSESLDLPFEFRFYNRNYSTLTVCSNGWLSPGFTDNNSFMNWSIPGPGGPSPLIAPFWDDLRIGNGNVCYFFDTEEYKFIIEWSQLQNDYNGDEETFQVILFDRDFYPATTGNSQILFQYKVINNVDQGQYGIFSNHGEHATVGIEDHSSAYGLEYTYSNQYPIAAKPLENEMAILFTAPPIPMSGPYIIFDSFEIDDSEFNDNGIVNPGEEIDLTILLKNIGNDIGFDVFADLLANDQYITILGSNCYYGDIAPSGSESGSFIFEVSPFCPDQHYLNFNVRISADDDYESSSMFSVEVLAPDIEVSCNVLIFEHAFIGFPLTKSLIIYNSGSDELNILDIYTTNQDFEIDLTSFDLDCGESQEIFITFTPTQSGTIDDTLFILSNDPDEQLLSTNLYAEILYAPEISISPDSLLMEMGENEIASQVLNIFNNGGSGLIFSIDLENDSGPGIAANFDGENDYISIPDPVINTEYFTIEMWANMQGQGGGSVPYSPLFQQRDDVPSDNHSTIVLYSETNIDQARFFVRSYFSEGQALVTESLPYFEWHHYAGIVSEESIIFYIDGNLIGSIENLQDGNYSTSIDYVDIGRHRYWNETHGLFEGYIDEVRIWNYPRTQEEIQDKMSTTLSGNEPGLNAYWNFDDENPWIDVTGNSFDGTPHGNISTIESTAPIISWLSLDNSSDTIPEESFIEITITFDSSDLLIGNYYADMTIFSNDPLILELNVPLTLSVTGDKIDDELLLMHTSLIGNFPNPFNSGTIISFSLNQKIENTILEIYNIKGQKVTTLINEKLSAGYHEIHWNGKDNEGNPVSSGIYFYKMKTGKYSKIRKMLLLR